MDEAIPLDHPQQVLGRVGCGGRGCRGISQSVRKVNSGGSDFRLYDGSDFKTYPLMRW